MNISLDEKYTIFHTFLWHGDTSNFLPKQKKRSFSYNLSHVQTLHDRLEKIYGNSFQLNCYTDIEIDDLSDIKFFKLWDEFSELGGCYRRLALINNYELNESAINVMIDLDIVPLNGFDRLFDENLSTRFYHVTRNGKQHLNGGLYQFVPSDLYDIYSWFKEHKDNFLLNKRFEGSDQALLRHYYNDEAVKLNYNEKIIELSDVAKFTVRINNIFCVAAHGSNDMFSKKARIKYPFLLFN